VAEREREVWTGLVEVAADDGSDIFGGAPGAFANVFALASSVEDYMAVTAPALLREGVVAVDVDDPEPVRERKAREMLSEDFLALAERAGEGEVVWDTFYVFEKDEDAEGDDPLTAG
jgi:hypothetical protein